MHDPQTLAFEIKYPWVRSTTTLKSGRVIKHRDAIVSVWHVDPERDGSDDSCGWTLPHLTIAQKDRLKSLVWDEGRHPYFLRCAAKEWDGSRAEAEALYRALLLHVARAVGVQMSFDEAARRAALAIHGPDSIDAASRFCFLPGYHTNFDRDTPEDRERVFAGIVSAMARWLLADRRRAWRHPRWHVWHWRVVFHPWRNLRRWLFVRCGHCGRRFGWHESPVTYSWSGGGPIYHQGCTSAFERDSAIERVISDSAQVAP